MKYFVLLVLIFFSVDKKVYGWWATTHYILTKEATANQDQARAANLPDYTSNLSMITWGDICEIPQHFLWCHGVVYTKEYGGTILGIKAPMAPEYSLDSSGADDGRYPGVVMWDLLKNKIDQSKVPASVNKTLLENMIKGYRAHNAGDRVVHWNVFTASGKEIPIEREGRWIMSTNYNGGDTLDAWAIHHKKKEEFAEFICYMDYLKKTLLPANASDDDCFIVNSSKERTDFIQHPDFANGLPVIGRDSSGNWNESELRPMAVMMQLAQKVYRKNSRNFDLVNKDYTFEVQSVAEIINEYKKEIFDGTTWDKLLPKDGGTHYKEWKNLKKMSEDYSYPKNESGKRLFLDETWTVDYLRSTFTMAKQEINTEVNKLRKGSVYEY